jgi:hypothetical protein
VQPEVVGQGQTGLSTELPIEAQAVVERPRMSPGQPARSVTGISTVRGASHLTGLALGAFRRWTYAGLLFPAVRLTCFFPPPLGGMMAGGDCGACTGL